MFKDKSNCQIFSGSLFDDIKSYRLIEYGGNLNIEYTSNTELNEEEIKIPNSILPHRVEGKMRCLPHKDEGLVNGKWAKGETTAANERRYVLQMQQDKLNYKQDGIKQVKYEFVKETKFTPWAKMIDIKL